MRRRLNVLSATQSRERGLVVGVESAGPAARAVATVATVATITTVAAAITTEAAAITTEAAAASSGVSAATSTSAEFASAFTSATAATAAATSTTSTVIARVGRGVVLAVDGEKVLLLHFLLAAGLLVGGGHVVLLFGSALDRLALGEVLLGALVGLTDLQGAAAQRQALLGLLGEVLVVRLGVVLGLRGGGLDIAILVSELGAVGESRVFGIDVGSEASFVLRFGLSNGLAGFFIGPLGGAGFSTPSVCGLLLVFADRQSVPGRIWSRGAQTHPMPVWL